MDKKVAIYTTPTCSYCKMAKEFFSQNGITYEEKNVVSDEKARKEMIEKSGQMGVPVIDIDGKLMVGFDKDKLSEALGIGT
jgi:glutaredoxin 3